MQMEWITLVGAVIAAIAALYNIWLTYSNSRDSILVKAGTHTAIATPATGLYVVNTGKHPVYVSDFGFVQPNGKLFSIPWYHETEGLQEGEDYHEYNVGTTSIEPHDLFSIGISYQPEIIGVYAITSTQSLPRINMTRSRLWPKVFFYYLVAKFRHRNY